MSGLLQGLASHIKAFLQAWRAHGSCCDTGVRKDSRGWTNSRHWETGVVSARVPEEGGHVYSAERVHETTKDWDWLLPSSSESGPESSYMLNILSKKWLYL